MGRGRPRLTVHPDCESLAVPGLAQGASGLPMRVPTLPFVATRDSACLLYALFMGRAALMGPKGLLSQRQPFPQLFLRRWRERGGVASALCSVRASVHFQCHRAAGGAAESVSSPALVPSFPGAHCALGLWPFTGRPCADLDSRAEGQQDAGRPPGRGAAPAPT